VRTGWTRLRELPLVHPFAVALVVLATLVPAALLTARIEVRSSFSELLPRSRPSVVELARVRSRLAGVSTLIVAIEGRDEASLRRFIDGLSPKIRGLGRAYVSGVDEGSREARRFVNAHRALYADLDSLRAVHDDVLSRYDYEVGKRSGLDLGIADEAPAPITAESVKERFRNETDSAEKSLGTGYYIGEGGKLGAIVVRTPFDSGDPRAFDLEDRVSALARELHPEKWDPSLSIHFTGSLVTSAEEHRAVVHDLRHVGGLGVVAILGIVFAFFLRVRVLLAMIATIGTGCLWTFAFAYSSVGYLNSASGFLVSIIAGNGINFGILLMARYLEARTEERRAPVEAVRMAMSATARGTLAVALCSSVAYGSLALTDFRGFRHFGVIGGAGMLLCWIATYTLLPALLVSMEKLVPLEAGNGFRTRIRHAFGRPFAFAATRYPGWVAVLGAVSVIASAACTYRYFAKDPLEYDMRAVRNDAPSKDSARALAHRVYPLVGRLTREGRAMLVDRLDQVAPLETVLRARRDAAPAGAKPFERVVSAFDLLPKDQDAKLVLIAEIKDRARRAHRLGAVSDEDDRALRKELPDELRPLTINDLPRDVAWPFEEADGTRGKLVYLVPTSGRSLDDVHYLMKWADSFRRVELPNGEVVRGTGDPVIFADMLGTIRADAPKAMLFALLGTSCIVLLAFRGRSTGRYAMCSVALGVTWLISFMFLTHARINFLNFVALPITVGVSADYAVNLMKRYEHEGPEGLPRSLVETGSALVLCSLTTLLGYAALTLSTNGAVRSFGLAGAVGEITALVAALVILPAALLVRARRGRSRDRLADSGVRNVGTVDRGRAHGRFEQDGSMKESRVS
jgi:predicted RND superfamily exporter protein